MHKYQLGQKLYWFKYSGHRPELVSFEVGQIKLTKEGYKYGLDTPNGVWVTEEIAFETIEGAVNYGCQALKKFL